MARAIGVSIARKLISLLPGRLGLRSLATLEGRLGQVDPEILHLPGLLPPERRRVALDIGANQGVMTYYLARSFTHVHAFEPNPHLSSQLLSRVPSNVRVWPIALSDQCSKRQLHVPVQSGIAMAGWGSLEGNPFESGETVEFAVETSTIDSLRLSEVDFIKMDVERHELAVLRGARELIATYRPWISVEVWPPLRADVARLMHSYGYNEVPLLELAGVPGAASNLVFLPETAAAAP